MIEVKVNDIFIIITIQAAEKAIRKVDKAVATLSERRIEMHVEVIQ